MPRRVRGGRSAPVRCRCPVALALVIVSCRPRGSPSPDRDAPAAGPTMTAETMAPQPLLPASRSVSSASSATVRLPPGVAGSETGPGAIRHRFRKTSLTAEELSHLVSASPELARVGGEASFFDPGDTQFLVRSKADREGVSFTTVPLLWTPESGAELLVVTGHGKAASFVAAWWVLPGDEYRLASSFVMLGEVAPVALAYRPEERNLWWTSCWQCPGETGHVSLREDRHVVIVQD
jgi:hypothetical protein